MSTSLTPGLYSELRRFSVLFSHRYRDSEWHRQPHRRGKPLGHLFRYLLPFVKPFGGADVQSFEPTSERSRGEELGREEEQDVKG